MTTWALFTDEADFRRYHDAVCAELGIPFAGQNQATGVDDLEAQWTTAATDPVIDVDGTLKALVRDDDLAAYDLKPTDPPAIPDPADLTWPTAPPWDWHQPIPETAKG